MAGTNPLADFKLPTQPSQPQQTPAQKAQQILNAIPRIVAQLIAQRAAQYASVWSDPINVVGALGTAAAAVFAGDAALVTFIATQLAQAGATITQVGGATIATFGNGNVVTLPGVPAGWSYVANADGTVTLTAPTS